MGDKPEITPERIRQFALDGGLSEEAVSHFLDSKCHMLLARNLPAPVVQDILPYITEVGLVVGFQESPENPGSLHLGAWLPFDHAPKILADIRELHKRHGIECPHELQDFESQDSSMCGKDYIRAMLLGYTQKYGDLPS